MSILSILVMYNCTIQNSKTIASLLQGYANNPHNYKSFEVIIYDNSLNDQSKSLDIPFKYKYVHNPNNEGIAIAYNYALREATLNNYKWLLLLDQDSYLPKDFIQIINNTLPYAEKNNSIVAIVPKLFYNNRIFSPSKVLFGGMHRPINKKYKGISNFKITTVGSGVLVRTSFLQIIGGFNELFWLDFLDHWLFNTIHSLGKKVLVTDTIIEHNLSILNYDKYMTERRYHNILKYENIFMKSYRSKIENYIYLLRLLKRSIVLLYSAKNKKYSEMIFKNIIRLIFFSGINEKKSKS